MKNQCANLKKEVQEKMKSIREMKTTLEIFKRETEGVIRDMAERLKEIT